MTQANQILQYLQWGHTITALEAARTPFNCMRLAARINDLRNKGHTIHSETVNNNGKSYSRYTLIKPGKLF
mgnify:FL=1